jgi:hypothetical protein
MASTTSAPFGERDFRVGRVISRSISILSRRFVTLFIIATLSYLPTFLISLRILGWRDRGAEQAEQDALLILLALAFSLFSVFGQAMIVHVAFQDIRRRPASLGVAVKVGRRRFRPLFGIAILLAILILLEAALFIGTLLIGLERPDLVPDFVLLLTPIPIVVVVTVCFVTIPACIVEERGPFDSVGRSAQLTKGHRRRIFGLELLLVGLLLITGIFIGALNSVLRPLAGPLMAAISGLLWGAVWVAYSAVMIAVAYHDLRVAKEGIDIEQIASVFD